MLIRFLGRILDQWLGFAGSNGSSTPSHNPALLLESGNYLLLESGDRLLLE